MPPLGRIPDRQENVQTHGGLLAVRLGLRARRSGPREAFENTQPPRAGPAGQSEPALVAVIHFMALAKALAVALTMASEVNVAPVTASTRKTPWLSTMSRGISVGAV